MKKNALLGCRSQGRRGGAFLDSKVTPITGPDAVQLPNPTLPFGKENRP